MDLIGVDRKSAYRVSSVWVPIRRHGERSTMMSTTMSRKEKRKSMKKQKRKQIRKAIAVKERTEEESRRDDPDEQLKARLREMEEAEVFEREMNKFEERERLFLESVATKKAMETAEAEQRQKMISEEFGNRDKVWSVLY